MTERTAEIQQIVDRYVRNYTCAQMAEKMITIDRETKQANDWFIQKRQELNITAEEIQNALEQCTIVPRNWDNNVIK